MNRHGPIVLIPILTTACNGGADRKLTSPPVTPRSDINSNALLSSLEIEGVDLDQIFQATQPEYTGDAGFLMASVRLRAIAADSGARVSAGGTPVGSEGIDVALVEGSNSIRVLVTGEDGVSTSTYTVTLDRRTAAEFAQTAYIKASNTEAWDHFGTSIAINANTLAVSAYQEDSAATGVNGDQTDNTARDTGAVYVFTRDETGAWTQRAYLKASNAELGDKFGATLALSGGTLAIRALGEDSAATGVNGDQSSNATPDSGAVYVFSRDTVGTWSQQAHLKASNAEAHDGFGVSVAISGSALAVAAIQETSASTGVNADQTDNSAMGAGAVYVLQ